MSHKATNWLSTLPATILGHSEFRVLFILCDCHNPAAGCFPTQEYLREQAGVSNGTINNVLNSLEAKGLIRRHRSRDGKSKRQRPTRYILGFELSEAQEPTPKNGDGKQAEPTPKIGVGADSNPEADPTPIQRPSRLQPTGEEPVKEPVNNLRAQGDAPKILKFWAEKINSGAHIPGNAISAAQAAALVASGLVAKDRIVALGLAG